MSPSFWGCVVLRGYNAAERAVAGSDVALDVESAGRGRQPGEAMVPTLAVHFGPKGVYPNLKRRIDPRGVFLELIVGAEANLLLELGVSFGPALAQDAIERPFQATVGGAVVGPPVQKPHRPRIVRIDGSDDKLHPVVGVVIAWYRPFEERLGRRVTRIVLAKPGIAISESANEQLHETKPGALFA